MERAGRPTRLFGRDAELERIVDVATSSAAAPLVVVLGPAGIGRSSVLDSAREQLAGRDVPTVSMRVARNERTRPYAVVYRLISELSAVRGRQAARNVDGTGSRRPAGSVHTGVDADSGTAVARRLAVALASVADGRRLVIFIDDLHWADTETLAAFAPLVRGLAGTGITVVTAVRTPVTETAEAFQTTLARWREGGLADLVTLRPLRAPEVHGLLADVLQARPTGRLSAAVQHYSRGIPLAVLAAAEGYQASGALRTLDREAYLLHPGKPPAVPADHPLFEPIRDQPAWPVLKALSVLHPLGDAALRLIAEAVGATEAEVLELLYEQWAAGVLLAGGKPGHWRFRSPLLAPALDSCLGPFERRRLSQLAVNAVWSGSASPSARSRSAPSVGSTVDARYLPERLVNAGKLVDSRRACAELLASGTAAIQNDCCFAERWLHAASALASEPSQRSQALFLHAVASRRHGNYESALHSARAALTTCAEHLSHDELQELEIIQVVALRGTNAVAELDDLIAAGYQTLPGGAAAQTVTRAAAMGVLDRWRAAGELLESTKDDWSAVGGMSAVYAHNLAALAALFVGDGTSQTLLADLDRWRPPEESPHSEAWRRSCCFSAVIRVLLVQGELDSAKRLLADNGLAQEHLPTSQQAMLAALTGNWDVALETGRLSLAAGTTVGDVPGHTEMCREMATMLIARGRLTQARAILDRAREAQPAQAHLLHLAEAEVQRILDGTAQIPPVMEEGLVLAAERGYVLGTDELWRRLGEWELALGNRERAEQCAAEVRRVAATVGTGRARLNDLLARVAIHHDTAAAREAVALARKRAQPFELAGTLTRVIGHGLEDAKLLREAYGLFGDLDALMSRAQLRSVMRAEGVAVPGRNETVTENERLLARLVTDGLTNRQLATVLHTTEKSVEGRLSRLFLRTGYRSRVELATAMLSGEYPD